LPEQILHERHVDARSSRLIAGQRRFGNEPEEWFVDIERDTSIHFPVQDVG
jgi:hypothetical protein